MKTKLSEVVFITLALILAALEPAAAQNVSTSSSSSGSTTRTDHSIEYHNGPVWTGTPVVYFIWYGNWAARIYQQLVVADFVSNFGSSPYFQINMGYPDSAG
jgi:hypothetical protein